MVRLQLRKETRYNFKIFKVFLLKVWKASQRGDYWDIVLFLAFIRTMTMVVVLTNISCFLLLLGLIVVLIKNHILSCNTLFKNETTTHEYIIQIPQSMDLTLALLYYRFDSILSIFSRLKSNNLWYSNPSLLQSVSKNKFCFEGSIPEPPSNPKDNLTAQFDLWMTLHIWSGTNAPLSRQAVKNNTWI